MLFFDIFYSSKKHHTSENDSLVVTFYITFSTKNIKQHNHFQFL